MLNLGIVAHVDAGKTSLTERLLFAAGVIDDIGRVDDGTTQTDSLAIERQRGITIRSAVVSFVIDDVTVNLIDTPGHPDFIAEVERVLSVLDGAVLVVSAVEGVQAQTRVLLRTLRRLRIPTLIFVNKVDRLGAREEGVLREIARNLTGDIVAMGSVCDVGARGAEVTAYGAADATFTAALTDRLTLHDETVLAAYVDGGAVPYRRLRTGLAAQTKRALLHPVFFGSATTGTGVRTLISGLTEFLPAAEGDADGPVAAVVFKVERGPAGEKVAYVRMFSGVLRIRDRLRFRGGAERKVTAIRVFERGLAVKRAAVCPGEIAKLWGLVDVRIGDAIGVPPTVADDPHFAPPSLETVVVARRAADKGLLHVALARLAEQDPLINLRQDDVRHEIAVSLYGEVQKEVIAETLATEFNIDVDFEETTTIYVERPVAAGAAVEVLGQKTNPFLATVGLRVEPAAAGCGVALSLAVKVESIPVHVYKAVTEFRDAIEETVRETLHQGLYGWEVIDCAVTMTQSGFVSPNTTARDFRLLTPLVLMTALKRAGTIVCEPVHRFRLEMPADVLGPALPVLARLGAVPAAPRIRGSTCVLDGDLPAARVHALQQRLRSLTHGRGVLESVFDHYDPVRGAVPTRPRTDHNPLSRKEYLLHLRRRL